MRDIKFFMLARNMDQDEILDNVVKGVVKMFCEKHLNPRAHDLTVAMQIGKAAPIQGALSDLSMAVVTAGEVLESTMQEFQATVKVREEYNKKSTTEVTGGTEEKDVETSKTGDDCEHVEKCELVDGPKVKSDLKKLETDMEKDANTWSNDESSEKAAFENPE